MRTESLWQNLIPIERRTARQIRHAGAQAEFVAARALLRVLLAGCLGTDPQRVLLKKTAHGKPFVPDWCNPQRLRFNVSHSHGHILIAIARGLEIGVDVEPVRNLDRMDETAREFMTPRESRLYEESGPQKPQTFFHVWTRKEAILKATGSGLLLPLRQTESLPGRTTIRSSRPGGPPTTTACHVESFETETGALAAVAACGRAFELSHHQV